MCGIVGILNKRREAASDLYTALLQLQHRGKESAAIAVSRQGTMVREGGMGEVPQAFFGKQLDELRGRVGIGHVRYGTAGSSAPQNLQPAKGTFRGQDFYLAHNGNLANTDELKIMVRADPQASDTLAIAELIGASAASSFEEALRETLLKLRGAFSLLILFQESIYVVKDPFGFHPLQIGRRKDDFIVASESCVFDHLGAEFVADVEPGEMLVIDSRGCSSRTWTLETQFAFDIFEFIYFLRPDSIVHGVEAGLARYHMGKFLAQEHPVQADIVVPIADSGNEAALGYYEGLDKENRAQFRPWALFRPHTVSRTFIEPVQETRERSVSLKFNARPSLISGKHVVLVDDSLIRATTLPKAVQLIREAGAKKVSAVISSPMYQYQDFYGIDTCRVRSELIAWNEKGNVEAIRERCGLDYLGYLSLDSTVEAVLKAAEKTYPKTAAKGELSKHNFYTGPFTGTYPAGKGKLLD